jgi:hypothetical protein
MQKFIVKVCTISKDEDYQVLDFELLAEYANEAVNKALLYYYKNKWANINNLDYFENDLVEAKKILADFTEKLSKFFNYTNKHETKVLSKIEEELLLKYRKTDMAFENFEKLSLDNKNKVLDYYLKTEI